ncbi:MAG: type II toxin-antitoxin system Phd/YefM family antitoxin [Rubrivivax sp.]|nr:type II toxin-antitoxin system Phd/YefM family antitoxin [Rubrivivax sp.]
MDVTATEAKNRLGQMLDHCQREPVVIAKQGRRHSVLISAAQYDALLLGQAVQQGHVGRNRADPGRAFYEKYKDWVDLQNNLVERFGIPGEEFRAW